jgi:hypothetical protein
MCAQSVVLFLKANPNHDRLGRFARAPADAAFDRALDIRNNRYGRVVLKPVPTADNIDQDRVPHFEFKSWHPIPFGRFRAAQDEAQGKHISPTAMRKSLPGGEGSSDILETFAGDSGDMHRFQKGIPFNWRPYFYGVHNRNPDGSDGGTEPQTDTSESDASFKALPTSAR